jgi:hypothetical protein
VGGVGGGGREGRGRGVRRSRALGWWWAGGQENGSGMLKSSCAVWCVQQCSTGSRQRAFLGWRVWRCVHPGAPVFAWIQHVCRRCGWRCHDRFCIAATAAVAREGVCADTQPHPHLIQGCPRYVCDKDIQHEDWLSGCDCVVSWAGWLRRCSRPSNARLLWQLPHTHLGGCVAQSIKEGCDYVLLVMLRL